MQIEDALRNYTVDPSTGCWIWKSSFTRQGYGQARIGRVMTTMHRFFFEAHKGAIAAGLLVCHACNNRKCVNPDHLYAGTRKQNAQDAIDCGSFAHGEAHSWSRLTEKEVLEIRASSESAKSIASRLGVTAWTIFDIRKGRRWKHLNQGHHRTPQKPRVRVQNRPQH